jgi:ubiquitin-conjugating enzyme E2 T
MMSSSGSGSSISTPLSSSLIGRLQKEYRQLTQHITEGIQCTPASTDHNSATGISADNVLQWHAIICGPVDTPYHGGIFHIAIDIPDRYPFQPPHVKFTTPIYHPNIDESGRICMDILSMPPKGQWKPTVNISGILTSIQSLLQYPNPDDPLIQAIAIEYKSNYIMFAKKAKEYTKKYAGQQSSSSNSSSTTQQQHEGNKENTAADLNNTNDNNSNSNDNNTSTSSSSNNNNNSDSTSTSISSDSTSVNSEKHPINDTVNGNDNNNSNTTVSISLKTNERKNHDTVDTTASDKHSHNASNNDNDNHNDNGIQQQQQDDSNNHPFNYNSNNDNNDINTVLPIVSSHDDDVDNDAIKDTVKSPQNRKSSSQHLKQRLENEDEESSMPSSNSKTRRSPRKKRKKY